VTTLQVGKRVSGRMIEGQSNGLGSMGDGEEGRRREQRVSSSFEVNPIVMP
jgi:hypothetical protein